MNKQTTLKFLNPVLAALVILQASSGLLAVRGLIPREVFKIVHEGGGILLVIGVCLHVTLNWSWVKAVFLPRKAGP